MNYVERGKLHIEEILRFLRKLDFKDIDGGTNFEIGGRQVDACAGHENTLLIIECTTQKDINGKIDNFRGKISDIIHGFQRNEKYKKYNRYVSIIAIKYQRARKRHINHALYSKSRKIFILDNNIINYYLNLQEAIGKYAKYNLLAELEIKPEKEERINIPALFTEVGPQKKYLLFIFFITASDLLKISYVARRELGHESFYQRMIKKSRLNEIAKYIQKGKIFPNSIIVALNDECWNCNILKDKNLGDLKDTKSKWVNLCNLTLVNNYRSCWIIDGQHRLFSYAKTTTDGCLAVSAFANLEMEKQADYFLDINKEAKTVDPNLLWDLIGTLEYNSTRGIISNTVKSLRKMNNGFFKNNIKIPSLGGGFYNFNNICVSIEKNELAEHEIGFLYKKGNNPFANRDHRIFESNLSKGLNQFFLCFDEGLDADKKNLLSNGFISVMISLFKNLITFLERRSTIKDEKDFFTPLWETFNKYSDENIKDVKTKLSSEGGKKNFRNDIIRILQESYNNNFALGVIKGEVTLAEKIKDLDFRLNELVNNILTENVDKDWIENPRYFTDGAQRKKCIEKSKIQNEPAWTFINFLTTINIIILNTELWGRFFMKVFIFNGSGIQNKEELKVYSKKLWDYRSNKIGHKRSKPIIYSPAEESLVQNFYSIFSSIIDRRIE